MAGSDDFDVEDHDRGSQIDYVGSSESEPDEPERDDDEENSDHNDGDERPVPQDTTAEMEIENDFDRLVQSIREPDEISATSLLRKDWDFDIQEKYIEFRDDLRAASGIGRQTKGKRGRTAGPVLSQEVRALIGQGNQAYVDVDIPEAIRIMQEVIRIEPRASSAWSVLAQCYEDQQQPHKALQLRIMAAHLRHDADEWERLARESKSLGYFQQALYCFGKWCKLDPTNVDALWDRASLAKEIGDLRTARTALLSILKRVPHDLVVLSELRPILIDLSEFTLCASLFQDAFDHYQGLYPSGIPDVTVSDTAQVPTSSGSSSGPIQCFDMLDILVLVDLYNTPALAAHENAVTTIRRGCRWLQGRGDQKFWDLCEDDREYDPPGANARVGGVQPGRYPLDVNARQRLAVGRIKIGDFEEGKLHASIVLSHDVMDYAPLFAEIADAYFDKDVYADAKPIYELLGADAGTSSLYVLMQTAACHRMLGELGDAAEVYEHVKSADSENNDVKMKLAEIYEILNEPRKALELVYEVIDSRKKRLAARGGNGAGPSGSLFEEKSRKSGRGGPVKVRDRLSAAQLKELEEGKVKEVLRGFKRIRELWGRVIASEDEGHTEHGGPKDEAEREWLFEAERLVETFRETRNLFLTSRNVPFRGMIRRRTKRREDEQEEADEDRMASRLHLDLEHDIMTRKAKRSEIKPEKVNMYREVSFDDWLRLFMQYAFLLTKHDQYDTADEVLRHILLSNAYQSRELQDTIRITLIACAIATHRYSVVVEQARKLISTHQFNNEPYRILLASLAPGMRSTDAFIASTLQKHVIREIRLGDVAVKNPDALKWRELSKRWVLIQGATEGRAADGEEPLETELVDDDPQEDAAEAGDDKRGPTVPTHGLPTKDNPMIVAIYGQICIAAKSYQSAIFYLLHAYEYCPTDPMICLSLAIASIGRAMQRQSDNRHHLIAQAMAFLSRYREIRGADIEGQDEIEFNFGRAFQQLGLHSLAVKHYEQVLALAENKPLDECGLAREAAYNLSLIFMTTGATPLAETLYRRWLSI